MTTPLPPELAALETELWPPGKHAAAMRECPGCLAHRGHGCFLRATHQTFLHDINGCDKPDLTRAPTKAGDPPAGCAIRLLCGDCLRMHRLQAEEMAKQARLVWEATGGALTVRCKCGLALDDVDNYLTVKDWHGYE